MKKPLEVILPSVTKGGRKGELPWFETMNGQKVSGRIYSKYIKSLDDLSTEELEYIVQEYMNQKFLINKAFQTLMDAI